MNFDERSLKLHRQHKGKIEIISKVPLASREDLSIAYTPGVAAVSQAIAKDPSQAQDLVSTKRMVAVVTNGTAVLGLGDIGAIAALPVMEGKAILFKEFAGIDAFPLAINTKDIDEFVQAVKLLAPTFGGINLEDIAAPACFTIEEQLIEALDIPVFHDDQHGTAIVVLAGLMNALRVVRKDLDSVRIVISGAGAAGTAVAKLLHTAGARSIVVVDSQGVINNKRADLPPAKQALLKFIRADEPSRTLQEALKDADVFIGVSRASLLTAADIKTMAEKAIVFALANPDPEIGPDEAKAGGAVIIATGRSDFPNQINNVLAFPGVFKGAFKAKARRITDDMKMAAATALAGLVPTPTADKIIPEPFDDGVVDAVAAAVADAA